MNARLLLPLAATLGLLLLTPAFAEDAATEGAKTGEAAPGAAPAPAGADPAAAEGSKLFAANGCGWCHEGGGRSAGKGPQLQGTSRTDQFITYRIKHGKEGQMPAFGPSFSDEQIKQLIAYIRSLKQ